MNNYYVLYADFNKEKNRKAWMITLGVAGGLLLMFMLYKWPLPTLPPPVAEEYIEVDLGDSETGSNGEEEYLPGDPAPSQQVAYNAPAPSTSSSTEDAKSFDENEEPDAAVVKNPTVPKPNATKINAENKTVKTNLPPAPAVPAPQTPKAAMGKTMGSNGSGGNGADTYKPGAGDGTGGTGNRGSTGGNPNGSTTGRPRTGIKVINMPNQVFQDDFKEAGKIVLKVVVNSEGRLVSASYVIKGSTLPKNSVQYNVAVQRAKEMKWPKYEGGFTHEQPFEFKVN